MLECIGALTKEKKGNTEMAYQDAVTAPIGREHDDDAVGQEDDPDEPTTPEEQDVLQEVTSAVGKVCLAVLKLNYD